METTRSSELFAKAQGYIPGGVNSPVRSFRSVGGTPLFIQRGKGSRVWDADGNELVDYVGSWGPLILGHAHDSVVEAVERALGNGLSFGAPTEAEVELASMIVDALPSVDMVRLVSSGTEATMSAIRAARAFTGRSKIVKFAGCYHGHNDGLLVEAGSGCGDIQHTQQRRRARGLRPGDPGRRLQRRSSQSNASSTPTRARLRRLSWSLWRRTWALYPRPRAFLKR